MPRKVYYFSMTCPRKEGKKGRGHPSDHVCEMDCTWLDFDRIAGVYVCGWPRAGHVPHDGTGMTGAPERLRTAEGADALMVGVDADSIMYCPECDYHTKPVGRGRLRRMVRSTLLKHLIHIHHYNHDDAVTKLEELGYAVEGTDLSEFSTQFETMVGGSL